MRDLTRLVVIIRTMIRDIQAFAQVGAGFHLRGYQLAAAKAIIAAVWQRRGDSFVVMLPRQSGKNETQAYLEAYLLMTLSNKHAEMVKVSPTWKPQSQNAMRRLERVLKSHKVLQSLYRKESGYIYAVDSARLFFLSGAPESNIVGATANALLQVDEAQDVQAEKFDKEVLPMAASTNATRVFWGTAWTSKTLLARELRLARAAEEVDGRQRVFTASADEIGREVPAYRNFVAEQVRRLGRNHPLVRTQYFSEEIDAQAGLFPAARRALMQGDHPPAEGPSQGAAYALLLDVAGEDETPLDDLAAEYSRAAEYSPSRRDSTALTVVEVDLAGMGDPLVNAPTYRVVSRQEWVGQKHALLYGEIKARFQHWHARYLVVDATGVGAGLASFLDRALPGRVVPFIFSAKSKSDLGWQFLAVIETGRYREHAPSAGEAGVLQARFWEQAAGCESQIQEGPGKVLRWGVPQGRVSETTGQPLHDDLLMSAALVAVLDGKTWAYPGKPVFIPRADPLRELDRGF